MGALQLMALCPNAELIKLKTFDQGPLKERISTQAYEFYRDGVLWGSLQNPITDKEVQLVFNLIEEINPDLLCVSTRSFGLPIAHQFVDDLKFAGFDMPVLAGGWGPTMEPEKALEWADHVVFGEGERTWKDIISQGLHAGINNLIYKRDGRLVRNPCYPLMTEDELSQLPYPVTRGWLVDNNEITTSKDDGYNIFCGRGCPLSCSYCMSGQYQKLYKELYGLRCPKHRVASVDRVLRELKAHDFEWVKFKDEVFPFGKWIEEFIDRYPKEIGKPFFAYVRPEFHPKSVLEKLIDIGLNRTCVGIQSASPSISLIYNRHIKPESNLDLAVILKRRGVSYTYHLLCDNPFETEKDLKANLKYMWTLPYNNIVVYKCAQFPGSPLTKMIKEVQPKGLPKPIIEWYAFLYCLAVGGKWRRRVSKVIYYTWLFRMHPGVLTGSYRLLKWVKNL